MREVVQELSAGRAGDLVVVVRKLLRASELLGWVAAAKWFRDELVGFTPESAPHHRIAACTVTWTSDSLDAWASSGMVIPSEIRPINTFKPLPNGLAELLNYADVGFSWETSLSQEVKVLLMRQTSTFRERVTFHPSAVRDILNRIEHYCYSLAVQVERQLRFGDLTADLFAEYRASAGDALARLGIGETLTAIEPNLRLNTPDSCKLAIHGCRNVLIALSHELWQVPGLTVHPTLKTHDGKPLQLDRNQVKARFRAYLYERGVEITSQRGGRSLISGQIDYLSDTFDQLYNVSSEQAKHKATLDEAKAATLQMYFLIGEIARLTRLEPVTALSGEILP